MEDGVENVFGPVDLFVVDDCNGHFFVVRPLCVSSARDGFYFSERNDGCIILLNEHIPWFQLGLGQRIHLDRLIIQLGILHCRFCDITEWTNVILVKLDGGCAVI